MRYKAQNQENNIILKYGHMDGPGEHYASEINQRKTKTMVSLICGI